MYANVQQLAPFISIKSSYVTGTVKDNVGVISKSDVYGTWSAVMARANTPPLTITGNQWSTRNGGLFDSWWANAGYSTLAAWEAAAGQSGNSIGALTTITLPKYALALSAADRTLCASALNAVAYLPGMDHGNDSFGIPLPGARATALATRLTGADSPVTLPEFIVLGFALTRMDSPASLALRTRIEALVS
jgi:hypothetical protein